MTVTVGLDVGNGAVKGVVFAGDTCLAKVSERIRRRDPAALARDIHERLLEEAGVAPADVAYVATTGEAQGLDFATGHFFSMTSHARGAVFLDAQARAVVDVGALHGRAMAVDGRGKVLAHRMTSQCASGSGRFLEDIARYLGIALDEIGPMSAGAGDSEEISGICAVLAETDVINMVSRGVPIPNILKGIHTAMAVRLVRLVDAVGGGNGTILFTGGLACDIGLLKAVNGVMDGREVTAVARAHADSIFAGAMGAALWGAFRHRKLTLEGGSVMAGG